MTREEEIKKAYKAFASDIENDGDRLLLETGFLRGAEWADEHPVVTENTSDGYHTFKELYDFRLVYNAALFNELVKQGIKVTKSRRHHDGNKCFDSDDWFIVQAELPTGQISNHYEASYWDYFKVPEVAKADEWDGHTPQYVQERLTKFILEHQ